jgi:hypothetical protein
LKENLAEAEAHIAERLSASVQRGQLPSGYSPEQGARRAINAMLSLNARARIGTSRDELLSDAGDATSAVLGTQIGP